MPQAFEFRADSYDLLHEDPNGQAQCARHAGECAVALRRLEDALVSLSAGCAIAPGRQTVEAVKSSLSAMLGDRALHAGARALAQDMARLPDAAAAAAKLERWQSHAPPGSE